MKYEIQVSHTSTMRKLLLIVQNDYDDILEKKVDKRSSNSKSSLTRLISMMMIYCHDFFQRRQFSYFFRFSISDNIIICLGIFSLMMIFVIINLSLTLILI